MPRREAFVAFVAFYKRFRTTIFKNFFLCRARTPNAINATNQKRGRVRLTSSGNLSAPAMRRKKKRGKGRPRLAKTKEKSENATTGGGTPRRPPTHTTGAASIGIQPRPPFAVHFPRNMKDPQPTANRDSRPRWTPCRRKSALPPPPDVITARAREPAADMPGNHTTVQAAGGGHHTRTTYSPESPPHTAVHLLPHHHHGARYETRKGHRPAHAPPPGHLSRRKSALPPPPDVIRKGKGTRRKHTAAHAPEVDTTPATLATPPTYPPHHSKGPSSAPQTYRKTRPARKHPGDTKAHPKSAISRSVVLCIIEHNLFSRKSDLKISKFSKRRKTANHAAAHPVFISQTFTDRGKQFRFAVKL